MLGPHGGRGGQKRPKIGPHGLCMTPNLKNHILNIDFLTFSDVEKFLHEINKTLSIVGKPNLHSLNRERILCLYL